MASNGCKYEENLTEAIRNLWDSNNGNHRKSATQPTDVLADMDTPLDLTQLSRSGKGTALSAAALSLAVQGSA